MTPAQRIRWFFTPYNAQGDSPFWGVLCILMMITWVFGLPWIVYFALSFKE